MRPPNSTTWKLAAAVALAVFAVAFVSERFGGFHRTGEEGAGVWFYDQSAKRLYAMPRDTLPPDKGIGGPSGDGVRAVVVAFRGEQNDPRKRRIAYLESYTPELKQLLDQIRTAHVSGQPFAGGVPARNSDFVQTNTLVKSVEDSAWHAASSPEGQRAMTAWRSWRGPDGQAPVICVP